MKSIRHTLAMALAATSTLLLVGTSAFAAQPKPGDAFPALEQYSFEGKLPEALKGKVVLLDFFASWCAPCKASFPALNEIHAKYAEKGLVVLAVNVDAKRADMDAFLKKHAAQFSVVRDAAQKLVAAAQVQTMPTSFLLDGAGRVRFVHSGYHGDETKKQYMQEIESLLNLKAAQR